MPAAAAPAAAPAAPYRTEIARTNTDYILFHFNISSRHLTAKVGGPCHVIERRNVTYHLDTNHLSRVKSHF